MTDKTRAAVRLDRFSDVETLKRGQSSMSQSLNQSPSAPGFDQVKVPGQKEAETLLERQREGIPLSPATWTDLKSLSDQYGIPLPQELSREYNSRETHKHRAPRMLLTSFDGRTISRFFLDIVSRNHRKLFLSHRIHRRRFCARRAAAHGGLSV